MAGRSLRLPLLLGVSLAMAGARFADLWSTHTLDPALQGEQNPLHTLLGAGFWGLVAVNLLVLAGLTALVVRSLHLKDRVPRPAPGLAFPEFLSGFLLDHERPWYHVLWRTPERTRAQWLLGRMVILPTILVSLLAAAGNLLSYQAPAFAKAWAAVVGTPAGLLAVLGACIVAATGVWLLGEYLLYRLRGAALLRSLQGLGSS